MIAIVDYGAGNTMSVMNALDRLQTSYILTEDASEILAAEKVILPGVGHAGHAMNSIIDRNLVDTIKSVTQPLLGICVGMQLMYEWSEEGNTNCLGIIKTRVKRFDESNCIVPLVGWHKNQLKDNPLFRNVENGDVFYSVHSYRAEICQYTIATADYGGRYASAVQKDNFYGVQFHPEKSSKVGQQLIKNFIEL